MREGENPEVNPISGYRVLSDEELAFINKSKAWGELMSDLLGEAKHLIERRAAEQGTPDGEHLRALALAKTNLQQGFMWLTRAVAAPTSVM